MLPALAFSCVAGCSSTIAGPGPVPTSSVSPAPPGVLLRGPATRLSFSSQGDAGTILVPKQIGVLANDHANVVAGPSPQASMPPIPLVPGPFYTRPIVYTAVTFTKRTTMQHRPGLTFDLPPSIDPNFGTFFLAFYGTSGGWDTLASTHGSSGQTIAFVPAGAQATYQATIPYGIALYQLADVEMPVPMPSPATVQLTEAGKIAKIDVSEPDYYGKWTATSSSPAVATVSPGLSGHPRFTVTAVKAGKATITFTDSAGGTGTVFVGVTTSGGGIH
jgi:hypothetical protein